jgi:hypothetical protein
MNYKKEIKSKDFALALSLEKYQVTRIKNAIQKAYDQQWHNDGPNIDQINAIVAPYIKTQEEAFYAATVILTDVFGAMMSLPKDKRGFTP